MIENAVMATDPTRDLPLDLHSTASRTAIRIVIVGAGNVGATFAYALLMNGLATEIVLLDADRSKAEGQAMDLDHAVPFGRPTRVWAGDWSDCNGAQIVVIACGSAQHPGETRFDLEKRNWVVVEAVVKAVTAQTTDAILLVATNPVDVMTYGAWRTSGLAPSRVFGSGTALDTARFRFLLGRELSVDPRSIHAFIIGEHGDSEVAVWSHANVAGVPVTSFAPASLDREKILLCTRDAAYDIIERKGATYFAIASALLRIVEAVIRDQQTVMAVSSVVFDRFETPEVCLSLPSIVGGGGISRVVNLDLSEDEREKLAKSAQIVRAHIEHLGLHRPHQA